MEIMIYGTITESGVAWGIYHRKTDLNWTRVVTNDTYGREGLCNMIMYALEYYKDAHVLLGGCWFDHEQLRNKLYEILDNM